MVWRELSPRDLYDLRNPLIIDVRSPCEFEEERIPEAINFPLLSNEERAQIGFLYKNQGELYARRYALKFIAPKIPDIVDQILALREHGNSVVIHCWRGGLRSEAVASVLSIAGIPCLRLTGGYKAWRRMIVDDLTRDAYPFDPIVLYGNTGSGKTDILEELQRQGAQILDLELLANHRGSTFGSIGKGKQPSQKNFEAALWSELRRFDRSQTVFLEAESRKIGKIALPNLILEKIKKGHAVLVEGSMDKRIERILSTYWDCQNADATSALDEAFQLLEFIKVRIGKKRCDDIRSLAAQGKLSDVVEILLSEYYDPLYRESTKHQQNYLVTVSGDNPSASATELLKLSVTAQ
jgi:tRNA 2-selenouridine synthase